MSNLQTTPIKYNSEQINKIVLTNVVKMITNRGLLLKANIDNNIDKLIKKESLNNTYEIKLDNPIIDDADDKFNGKILHVAIFDQEIKTINNSNPMIKFIEQHKNYQKIIILKSISAKPKFTIKQKYPHTEIFEEGNLMLDMAESFNIPKHIPLSQEESDMVIKEYASQKKQIPKILDTDPMGCYYNLQPGQIVRILRPSEVTGYSVYYRLTVKDSSALIDKT